MCVITLIPIVKPCATGDPHPQTILFAAKPSEQVLSAEEQQVNDRYLTSHGLSPEPSLIFPASSDWPSHATPIGGPYPAACVPYPPTSQPASTFIHVQQEQGFGTGYTSQAAHASASSPMAFGHKAQVPYLSSGYPHPEVSRQQYHPAPCTPFPYGYIPFGKKPYFPALVPDRVVPRSQHNLSPVKVPSNYGIKAAYCDEVMEAYTIYHTQHLREAEPEPKQMPHLCTLVYGANGNVLFQDGRHVDEGDVGGLMSPESYVNGLMAEDTLDEKENTKTDRDIGKVEAEAMSVAVSVAQATPEMHHTSLPPQRPAQDGNLYIGPPNANLRARYSNAQGTYSTTHLPTVQPQRAPSPRYVPAEHEPLPADQGAVLAAMKRMIGVDENWQATGTFAQTQLDWDFAEMDLGNGEGPSNSARAEHQRAGCFDGKRAWSFPQERRGKQINVKIRGQGKGKAPVKKGSRRGRRGMALHQLHPLQSAAPRFPPAWHPSLPSSSTLLPPLTLGFPLPRDTYPPRPSASYTYHPTIPKHPKTPTERSVPHLTGHLEGISSLSIPVPPNSPEGTQPSHTSLSPESADAAAIPALLPERLATSRSYLTMSANRDKEVARRGLGNRRSRASTTSLPCEAVGLWSEDF